MWIPVEGAITNGLGVLREHGSHHYQVLSGSYLWVKVILTATNCSKLVTLENQPPYTVVKFVIRISSFDVLLFCLFFTVIISESANDLFTGAVSTVKSYIPDVPEALSSSIDACYPYYNAVCSKVNYLNQLGPEYVDFLCSMYSSLTSKITTYYDTFSDQLVSGFLYLHSFIRWD